MKEEPGNSLFHSLYANTNDGVIIYDPSFFILDLNPAMLKILGYGKEEMIGAPLEEFFPVEKKSELMVLIKSSRKKKKPGALMLEYLCKSGESRRLECHEVESSRGEEKVFLSIVRDPGEQMEFKAGFQIDTKFVDALIQTFPGIFYLVEISEDEQPMLVYWNDHFQAEAKMPAEKLYRKNVLDFFSEEEQEIVRKDIRKIVTGEEVYVSEVLNPIAGDGSVSRFRYHTASFIRDGKTYYMGTGTNINLERDHEKRIIESVIQTEESERRRISSDLHNGLGAELSTIKLYLEGFLDSDDKAYQKTIGDKLYKMIEDAVDSISDISFNISPHILLEYGIEAAVEAFIDKLKSQGSLQLDFQSDDIGRFGVNEEVTLYRTITELINNTMKHADAEKIVLHLRKSDRQITVFYSDNGRGFNLKKATESLKGMGLVNMKSRIESLEGTFQMASSINSGMQATINLPYN